MLFYVVLHKFHHLWLFCFLLPNLYIFLHRKYWFLPFFFCLIVCYHLSLPKTVCTLVLGLRLKSRHHFLIDKFRNLCRYLLFSNLHYFLVARNFGEQILGVLALLGYVIQIMIGLGWHYLQ